MIVFPNAKINLGLNITEKRADGYHNLETVFYPIPLKDALEIVPSDDNKHTLHVSGVPIDGNPEQNLVMKALKLLSDAYTIPALDIFLEKIIPSGAGLGGGSADGAFMLGLVNKLLQLNISNAELEKYAARLGADCPFFIENKAVFASGTGTILNPIDLSLKGLFIVLVKPDVHVPTPLAYSLISPRKPELSLKKIILQPVATWKNVLVNDFEEPIIGKYPVIGKIKEMLYAHGALYASMSGSGSSVFGLFTSPVDLSHHFSDHFIFQQELL
jgi:4-diphosphocytidyl-2-C-methyl-D-erythritol kinase